jgi:hypothetical protein
MKWLTELFGGKIVEDAGKAIDAISTSAEEKARAKNELSKTVLDSLNRLQEAQRDVLVAEITGSKIQRLWRPVVMLAFAFIVVFHFFAYPTIKAFKAELPELPDLVPQFWTLLELGIGGYVIGRSAEKISENVTRNIDLSQLKRKDRREAMKDQVDQGED